MQEPKFSGAYCEYLKKSLSLSEIIKLENDDRINFEKHIRYSLFCPECHFAKLSYVHKNEIHLRAFPNYNHGEDCSLVQDTVDNARMQELINDNSNNKILNNKLKNFAASVFVDRNNDILKNAQKFEPYCENKKETNAIVRISKTKKVKYIPRQNISKGIFIEDIGVYKFFYGKINLLWYTKYKSNATNEMHPKILKLLAFKAGNDKHSMFSITMTERVAEYIKKVIPESKSLKEVSVVFLSFLYKQNNGYYNFHIKHSTHFVVFNQNT